MYAYFLEIHQFKNVVISRKKGDNYLSAVLIWSYLPLYINCLFFLMSPV